MKNLTQSTNSPGALAWTAAFISVGILLLYFYLVFYGVERGQKWSALNQIEKGIYYHSLDSYEKEVNFLVNTKEAPIVGELLRIIELSHRDEFAALSDHLSTFRQRSNLWESLEWESRAKLELLIDELFTASEDYRKVSARKSESKALLDRAAVRQNLLARQLISLLSLGDLPEEFDATGHYREGLLADLPVLPGLPDGIPDTLALSEIVAALPDRGEQLPVFDTAFLSRIDDVRVSSRAIIQERRNAEFALQAKSAELSEAKHVLDGLTRQTFEFIRRFVLG